MVGMHSSQIDSQVSSKNDCHQRSAPDVSGTKEESRTNLIVNYLPQSMSEDEIRSRFTSVGEVESCKLMKHKVTGQSLGYAFVNYRRPVDAIKAINMLNGLSLENKTIKVSFARPSSEAIVGANLYICGLPKLYTLKDLEDLFSPIGKIISSKILQGNMTQPTGSGSSNNVLCMSRGIGFIRYSLRTEAEKAIKVLNGTVPKGCTEPISVKFAHNPANSINIFPPVPPRMVVGVPNRLGLTPSNIIPPSSMPPHLTNHLLVRPKHPSVGNFRFNPMSVDYQVNAVFPGSIKNGLGWNIFVFNLPPETQENVLWQLFGPFGAVQSVKVIVDLQTNKCKGYGFVTMSNRDEAETAVRSLNGFSLGNRVLQVSFKTNKNGQCELSDVEQRDLRPGYDYLHDKEDFWMFTWDFGAPGCYMPPPPGKPPLLSEPHYPGDRGVEDTWARFTVNGIPCRAGTVCSQNHDIGVWTCPIDNGDWDYCCKSGHQCGYSDGFSYPWCYVGSSDREQWRPCSETYSPYAHSGRKAHWPVAYLHREGPPNITVNHRPSIVESFLKSLEKSGFSTPKTASDGNPKTHDEGGITSNEDSAMEKLLKWGKTALQNLTSSTIELQATAMTPLTTAQLPLDSITTALSTTDAGSSETPASTS